SIVFASWFGGLGPGLLSSVITLTLSFFFLPAPALNELLTSSDSVYFLTFALLSILISVLNGSLYAANQASREYAAQRERFIAIISHEIRTPLNGLIGMTGLLERTSLNELQK